MKNSKNQRQYSFRIIETDLNVSKNKRKKNPSTF